MKFAKVICAVVIAVSSLGFTFGFTHAEYNNGNSLVYSPVSNAIITKPTSIIN